MSLKVFTAQYRYGGPDRLDITVKGGTAKAFCPSWDMVMGYKNKTLSEAEYTIKYIKLMEESKIKYPEIWNELLNKESVTLVCFCANNSFCHRYILRDILVKMGAEYVTNR